MTDLVFSLRNIGKTRPGNEGFRLRIEQLDVARGSLLALVGPSGCGKSTLLGLMAGILLPTSGHVRLLEKSWRDLKPAQRDRYRADHVGYIFQQFNLVPYISALQNVLAPCHFSSRRQTAAIAAAGTVEACAQTLLATMGLSSTDIHQPASKLSVGQQQRVAAARALIGHPTLIIADEPTSALDDDNCHNFMDHLLSAAAQANSAVVFVSHNEALGQYFDRHIDLPDINTADRAPSEKQGVMQ